MFSGAGNIAAATGLVKKEEFPTDLKVSYPSTHTHTHTRYTHKSAARLPAPPAGLGHKPPCLTFCRAQIDTAWQESACGCVRAWRSL